MSLRAGGEDTSLPTKCGWNANRVRVCRPVLTNKAFIGVAEHFMSEYEDEFEILGGELKAGRADPTKALARIVEVIKFCVEKADKKCRVAPRKEGWGVHKGEKPHAPWFDQECHGFLKRFKKVWGSYRFQEKLFKRNAVKSDMFEIYKEEAQKARREYRGCCRTKRHEYLEAQRRAMIRTYFSSDQSDFWKAFNKGARAVSALHDVEECTEHFKGLYGNPVSGTHPLFGSWSPSVGRNSLSEEDCEQLNAPLTMEELAQCIKSAKCRKAADLDGMTMEAVKLLLHTKSMNILECIRLLLDNCHKEVPGQMEFNKLLPIPKGLNSGTNCNLHRGIAVSNIFGKLGDKFRNRRFSDISEERGLRCVTQCGFRKDHGTLDAMFTLRHLIDRARSGDNQEGLLCIFIDCTKAFDTASRELMLRRCEEVGVTGPFLEAMGKMFDKISMVVCLQGKQGKPFRTYQGTKQGSELSPLLFGLFIEQLHYLIEEKVPGAGPIIDGLHVADLFYADDVLLNVFNNPEEMQKLLDVVDLFCYLFNMSVNMPKTKALIFRTKEKIPKHLVDVAFKFRGEILQMVQEEKYLGLVMHAWM